MSHALGENRVISEWGIINLASSLEEKYEQSQDLAGED